MRTRLPLAIAAVLVLLAAGYAGLWWTAAGTLRARVEAVAAARVEAGLPTRYRALTVDGFPLALRARIDGAEAALDGPLAGLTWHGAGLVASVRPWTPRRIRLRLDGSQEIRGPAGPVLTATGRILAADFRLDGAGRATRLDARLRDLLLTPASGGAIAVQAADIAYRAKGEAADGAATGGNPDGEGPTFALDASEIRLPDAAGGALGRQVSRLIFEGQLAGDIPAGTTAAALAAWRDSGGTVDITHAEARWGPLHMAATGTLTLDAEMRPLGAFAARIVNYEAALDLFAAEGVLAPREAAIARTVFALVARRPADGGPPALEAALTIQDGRLSVGPVPLFDVPPLALPN